MLTIELIAVLVLVLLNGFFAMSEMAIVSSRRIRLSHMADQGRKGARVALQLYDEPSRFLSAVQVGITLVGTIAAAVSGATLAERLGAELDQLSWIAPHGAMTAFVLVVAAITVLQVILGELVPKRIALAYPEAIAAAVARPLQDIARIAKPIVIAMQAASAFVLWLLRVRPQSSQGVTEEEVKTVLAEGAESGVIDKVERKMMEEVLRLADRPVGSVMTPRRDLYWIDLADSDEKIREELQASPFSRILVGHDGQIDEPLGVILKKDLLNQVLAGQKLDIRAALRQPLYVPESASALKLLQLFKSQPLHLAVVVDEYGTIQGVVTPQDLLSTIAGDIQEDGEEASPPVIPREDGSFLVDGRCDLAELTNQLGLKTDEDADYHTAAGLALEAFARLPREGEVAHYLGWRIEVMDMDAARIDKLLFTRV